MARVQGSLFGKQTLESSMMSVKSDFSAFLSISFGLRDGRVFMVIAFGHWLLAISR